MVPDSVNPDELSSSEKEAKTKLIYDAWRTIGASGREGIERLKQEVKKAVPMQENYFKLNAARFLWMYGRWQKPPETPGGNWDEVPEILAIWDAARLSYHLHFPFHTAFEAAASRDPRAVPLMKALLKELDGAVQTPHMPIRWPKTNEFIWGVYGPKGLPILFDVLKTTKDPNEIMSAIGILPKAQYLEALPFVRKLATNNHAEIRAYALAGLAYYGHPEDFDLLASGLHTNSPYILELTSAGLALYGDIRAVPLLIPLLNSDNVKVRQRVIEALSTLLTPASLEALNRHAETTSVSSEANLCRNTVSNILNKMNLTWDAYVKKTPAEREELINKVRANLWSMSLEPDEHPLSRDEFLNAARQWKELHLLGGSIKARHLVAKATVEDIDLLLEVKAAILMRLSDECLYEAREIDTAIRYLGRSRYRKNPGITERVESR